MRISDWSSDVCSSDLRPLAEKAGVTIGMAMTEKQGGSDVRANATCAEPIGGGRAFRLTGHKWFCSAPMSDAFLTLAYTKKGLRSEEHTSELQSIMRISYAVFCLKKKSS